MKQLTLLSSVLLAVLAVEPAMGQAGAGSPGTGPGGLGDSVGTSANPAGLPGTTTTINDRMFGASPSAGATGSGLSSINKTNTRDTANTTASWDTQNNYWQQNYTTRPYYSNSRSYSEVRPAYQYGVSLYNENAGLPYTSLNQTQLASGWDDARGNSTMTWNEARPAVQDAYDHLYDNHVTRYPNAGTPAVPTANVTR